MRHALITLLLTGILSPALGTHIRSGEITVARPDCNQLTVVITLTIYTDLASVVGTGNGTLSFGDGVTMEIPTLTPTRLEGYPGVGVAVYTKEHTYTRQGDFLVTYSEPNRNAGVVNMGSSASEMFHIETEVAVDNTCNNSPVPGVPPVDQACTGKAFYHIPGGIDPDGDSLVYSLITPKASSGRDVSGYSLPLQWSDASESGDLPEFHIDPVSGLLTWDAPGRQGEFTITIRIDEYRKNRFTTEHLGSVTRDMQILVSDCNNNRPDLISYLDTCIVAGEVFRHNLSATDADGDPLRLEMYGELDSSDGLMVQGLNETTPVPADWEVSWQPSCEMIREKPYELVFKVVDQRDPPGSGYVPLSDYVIWRINVLAPAPEPEGIELSADGVKLDWEPYLTCDFGETDSIAVYRAVSGNPYAPAVCETGIRQNSGYSFLGSMPPGSVSFEDTALIPAARLCYRLVVFLANGTQSRVSEEICIDFIPADRPVITHVSVDKTGAADGEVIIGWREPYDLVSGKRPFNYTIERRTAATEFVPVGSVLMPLPSNDSIGFRDTGLNTRDSIYYYRIGLDTEDGTNRPLSEEASTVRLDLTHTSGSLALAWREDVPWQTFAAGEPHVVYRGDSEVQSWLEYVNPEENGQFFEDNSIESGRQYCYRVLSTGTYGNPVIASPLRNYSQVVCGVVGDTVLPGSPELSVGERDCTSAYFSVQEDQYPDSNDLSWTIPDDNDIAYYEILYKPGLEDSLVVVGQIPEASFTHSIEASRFSYPSLKGCYRIRAVDYSGNRGPLSNEVCVENCSNYALPNVFTPNDDGCNDVFASFGYSGSCGETSANAGPLFVNEVNISIYNRWGKKVYEHNGRPEDDNAGILILWDGRNVVGSLLPSGVYYYSAVVSFDLLKGESQTLKGWVHMIR